MSTAQNKIAGAPISWGVCEVPGWGYQLAPDRVLTEMREIGLAATELGPEGFLPAEPEAMANVLSRHRLHAIGGFTPLLLHRPDHDPLRDVIEVLERYAATGARTLVLSADSGLAGYDTRPTLDEQGWATLLTNLDRIDAVAAEQNVRAVLHPHVGTLIENGDEVQRVLEGSSISLCRARGRLRRLVRPRAGHHPHGRTPRRGPGGRRAHQRRVPASGDQRHRMIAWPSRR
jgi:inosose dehydratase